MHLSRGTNHVRAFLDPRFKNPTQSITNNILGALSVHNLEFERGQAQGPPAQTTKFLNSSQKPTEGKIVTMQFKLLVL